MIYGARRAHFLHHPIQSAPIQSNPLQSYPLAIAAKVKQSVASCIILDANWLRDRVRLPLSLSLSLSVGFSSISICIGRMEVGRKSVAPIGAYLSPATCFSSSGSTFANQDATAMAAITQTLRVIYGAGGGNCAANRGTLRDGAAGAAQLAMELRKRADWNPKLARKAPTGCINHRQTRQVRFQSAPMAH